MGITGLLPFLEKSSKRTNINEFSGGTVAIDSYCWLHRGTFSCADKLSMGQETDAYVTYCMKLVHMLLANKIEPILVFDGRHLPAKAQTEVKRQESREENRQKALSLMRTGNHMEARNLLRRSIDVTHEMALQLIKSCQKINVDCIVAPYEADAQLAYLNISGIADVVITEDSDLTLFGCSKVFFKMDITGNGLLVDKEKLHLAMGTSLEDFSMDNFRYMCILSGCDYLPSLPGIGLRKACKFITKNTDCDIHRALTRLNSYLNMKSLIVTKEYRDSFILADITFKHQLVFCPLQRRQVRLTPPEPEVTEQQLHYAGKETNPDLALQLAYGNCDPSTLKMVHDFDPDKAQKINIPARRSRISMWSKNYKLKKGRREFPSSRSITSWVHTEEKEMVLPTTRLKKIALAKEQDDSEGMELNKREILSMYKIENTVEPETESPTLEGRFAVPSETQLSPVLIRRSNPFSKQSANNKVSPSLLSKGRTRMRTRNIMRASRTIINEETTVESKYFATGSSTLTDAVSPHHYSEINDENIVLIDEMESNSHSMDVDEDVRDASDVDIYADKLLRQNSRFLDSSSNSDSGKSCLEARENKLANNRHSLSGSTRNGVDFVIDQQDANNSTLKNGSFKWSDRKLADQTDNKLKHRSLSSARTNADTKAAGLTSGRRNRQSSSLNKQQNLLSMYGFKKS